MQADEKHCVVNVKTPAMVSLVTWLAKIVIHDDLLKKKWVIFGCSM
jgi:hypothetical protein